MSISIDFRIFMIILESLYWLKQDVKIFVYERMSLKTNRCMSIFIDVGYWGIILERFEKPVLAEARYANIRLGTHESRNKKMHQHIQRCWAF